MTRLRQQLRLLPPHLLGRSGHRQLVSASVPNSNLGHPGCCPHLPTLTVMLFDDSASVTGGNDPIGNRYTEARIALNHVGKRCRCKQELCATLHFDTPTSADVPPTPIHGRYRARLMQGLAAPPDGRGCSLLAPSLRAAQQTAEAYPDHQKVLVVFSDFELFDPDLDRLLDEFGAFPGIPHAVVLRAVPPVQLVQDPRITVTRVDYDSPPGAVAEALFGVLTTYRPPRRKRITGGRR